MAHLKATIVGSGFVGSSTAFTIATKGLVNELVLIDVNNEKAMGEAMDISHGMPFLRQAKIYAGDYSDIKNSDIIIITAGANRKPGESRLDLAHSNAAILKEITENIMKHYNKGVILVVSNPLDVMTYLVHKISGLPDGKVFGSGTMLDNSRFRYYISNAVKVDTRNIHGYIVGEHGDGQVPAWSTVNIEGMKLDEYCKLFNLHLNKEAIYQNVKKGGAEVIKRKGATYYAIALSVTKIVGTVVKNQHTILPVSTVLNGQYGISDVALSLPCRIGKDGVTNVLEVDFSAQEIESLIKSAEQLKVIIKETGI